jgi:uncharacterized membrane protein
MTSQILLPILFAIAASFFYAFSDIFIRAVIRSSAPIAGVFTSLTVNVMVLWMLSFLFTDVELNLWSWRYFMLCGILGPVMGRFFKYASLVKLGITLSSPIVSSHPLIAVIIAIIFLGERLSFTGYSGIFLVISAGILIVSTKGTETIAVNKKYFILPILAAFGFGTSLTFRKMGMDLVPSPLLAGAVMTSSSWLFLALYIIVSQQYRKVRINKRQLLFFSCAGLCTCTAIPLLYLAYQIGNVLSVAPFANISPLFALILSRIFYRKEEIFSYQVILGTLLAICGTVLLISSRL